MHLPYRVMGLDLLHLNSLWHYKTTYMTTETKRVGNSLTVKQGGNVHINMLNSESRVNFQKLLCSAAHIKEQPIHS